MPKTSDQPNLPNLGELRLQLASSNSKLRIGAAFTLAKLGVFEGINLMIDALRDSAWSVRSDAAHYLGRIGVPQALPSLAEVATADPETQTRNVAIYGLEGIGRIACVPPLIDCLADKDLERREDARTALVRILGESVLEVMSDDLEEAEDSEPDPQEASRVRRWVELRSEQFAQKPVYYRGTLAHPSVFVAELFANLGKPMDAVLMKLEDWTATSFPLKSMGRIAEKWEEWLHSHERDFEPGVRYFYGHKIE